MREAFSSKESHKRGSKGLQALIVFLQRAFSTDRIPKKHDRKVHEVVMAEPTTGEAHALRNGRKHAQIPKIVRDYSHFAKPGRHGRNRLRRRLDGGRCLRHMG